MNPWLLLSTGFVVGFAVGGFGATWLWWRLHDHGPCLTPPPWVPHQVRDYREEQP